MKIALLYPCVAALIEKFASMFPGLRVIGPPCDDLYKWDARILPLAKAIDRQAEWKELGLDITFEEKPYSECDFSKFDLLIESVETFNYAADWKNHCHRLECPTIVFVCWYDNPSYLPPNYREKITNLPILLGMPSALPAWQADYPQARVVPIPVGDWWFEKPWTGGNGKALFVLAGKDLWRPSDKTVCGVDIWEKLVERFPNNTYHQDGAMNFRTSRQMTELFSESRVFVNLDRDGARPLCTSFTEAVSAGMPVLARDAPGLNYKHYIDGNGTCTEDFDTMCWFIEQCLTEPKLAKLYSVRSREVGERYYSVESARPIYEAAAMEAKAAFK